ncbi:MAG: LacI family transcriptional regulator [Pedobacter sp.]|nr:MAG: LacI family transcriptional regulator [Pedobacter sp.]
MFKPTTIKDIAKALNLSTSTVSRALRGGYEISEETKKIVLDYAEKINFTRNPIALSLKERRSYSIGVVVCEVANPFFSQAINGIESIAYNKGYHVIISQTHDKYSREVINIEHLANRSIDGLLISMSAAKIHSFFYRNSLSLVFLLFFVIAICAQAISGWKQYNEQLTEEKASQINLSEYLSSGHFISATFENFESEFLQMALYVLLTIGLRQIGSAESKSLDNKEEVESAIEDLLSRGEKPDGLFVASDRLSIGCLTAIKKHSDGDHPIIAGFSNSEVVSLLKPSISSVKQPAFEMGRKAAELLISIIESKYPIEEFETFVLDTEFHVNE